MPIKKNTTDIPNYFLHRMMQWVSNQIELPRNKIPNLTLTNGCTPSWYQSYGRGSPSSRHCVVRLDMSIGQVGRHFQNRLSRMETLVGTMAEALMVSKLRPKFTGHEFRRLQRRGRATVMELFIPQKEALLERWDKQTEKKTSPPSQKEKELERVEKYLLAWRRKLALATTKVKKYEKEFSRLQKTMPK